MPAYQVQMSFLVLSLQQPGRPWPRTTRGRPRSRPTRHRARHRNPCVPRLVAVLHCSWSRRAPGRRVHRRRNQRRRRVGGGNVETSTHSPPARADPGAGDRFIGQEARREDALEVRTGRHTPPSPHCALAARRPCTSERRPPSATIDEGPTPRCRRLRRSQRALTSFG